MHDHEFLKSLLISIGYDLLKLVVQLVIGAAVMAPVVIAVRRAFNVLKDLKSVLYLWGGGSIALGILLFALAPAPRPQRPDLRLQFAFAYGGRPLDKNGQPIKGALVVPIGSITNAGDVASVAVGFTLRLGINGKSYDGVSIKVPKQFDLDYPPIRLFEDDALYLRALTPISPGGVVQGMLVFSFPELEQDNVAPGTLVTFGCQDAFGDAYSQQVTITGQNSPPTILPTLHQEIREPTR